VLRAVLADGATTIVFTASRDTLHWLRERLHDLRPAWVSGDAAGIGAGRMAREQVLGHFRPAATRQSGGVSSPAILLATDVASEGLDLQRAERIVHYDLPWTSVRLDQRAGRALRLGSHRDQIELLAFAPAPELETLLRQEVRLDTKRRLTVTAGIDPEGKWLYRWRGEIVSGMADGPASEGITVVPGEERGWLVGVALDRVLAGGTVAHAPATLLWLDEEGGVSDDPERCVALLERARDRTGTPPTAAERTEALVHLAPVVRARLRLAYGESWQLQPAESRDRLSRRIRTLAAAAARERNRPRLTLLCRALDWLAGGLTAGELLLAGDLLSVSDERLPAALVRLMRRPRVAVTLLPRLTGIVRVTTLSPCHPSARCSSTSTAPSSIPPN
jgi:hypothetical protein